MFNFTGSIHNVIRHISTEMHSFKHIDPDRLVVGYTQTRVNGNYGVYASVIPLRFKNGSATIVNRGKVYRMPKMNIKGREILYIINFYMPRYMDLSFDVKLNTLFHELYHISPEFNGDIRRFPGRYYAHGHSRMKYNDSIRKFIDEYISIPGAVEKIEFLKYNFNELQARHQGIGGTRYRTPKPFVDKSMAAK